MRTLNFYPADGSIRDQNNQLVGLWEARIGEVMTAWGWFMAGDPAEAMEAVAIVEALH